MNRYTQAATSEATRQTIEELAKQERRSVAAMAGLLIDMGLRWYGVDDNQKPGYNAGGGER